MDEQQTYSARNTNDNSIEESSSIRPSMDSKETKKSLRCHIVITGLVVVVVFFPLVLFLIIGKKIATVQVKKADVLTSEKPEEGNHSVLKIPYSNCKLQSV